MMTNKLQVAGVSALLLLLAPLPTSSQREPASDRAQAVASHMPARDVVGRPKRQKVVVVTHRAATNRSVIAGEFRPARRDRAVHLQQLKRTWQTIATGRQDARGRVHFKVRAARNSAALVYRLRAPRHRGVGLVTSTKIDAAPWIAEQGESATSAAAPLVNLPAQAASIAWDSTDEVPAYAQPGGLVVAGRDNFQDAAFKRVSEAGGTVLIYLDAAIDNPHGRYHRLLNEDSFCGPATSRWPGDYPANEWGDLNDFRPGSVLQRKLECVLETMVDENPHMAGWFADDIGSRSWFPDLNWRTFPDKAAYRAGAIDLTQTFRRVADRHGLIFIVNGTWSARDGGGYPDYNLHGNALADGGFVEHHDGEIGYFGPYGCSSQWAAQSPVTRGQAFNYAVTHTAAGLSEYVDSGCYAYVNEQSYYASVEPWGTFHPTGLPSRVQ
jgi:hypothetical protein